MIPSDKEKPAEDAEAKDTETPPTGETPIARRTDRPAVTHHRRLTFPDRRTERVNQGAGQTFHRGDRSEFHSCHSSPVLSPR